MSNTNAYALVWAVDWPSSYHFSVAMVLARFSDETGHCALRHSAIARMACCSRRQVQRVLDDMAKADPPQIGLIAQQWDEGGKAINMVRLTLDAHLHTTEDRRIGAGDFFRSKAGIEAAIGANGRSAGRSVNGLLGASKRAIGRSKNKSESKSESQEQVLKGAVAPERQAFDAYNDIAQLHGWETAAQFTSARSGKLTQRLKQVDGVEGWARVLNEIPASAFLMGRISPRDGHKRFRMSLDFLLRESSFVKLLEGHYHDGKAVGVANSPPRQPEDVALRERLATDEAFALSLVKRWDQDPSSWPAWAGPDPLHPDCIAPSVVLMRFTDRIAMRAQGVDDALAQAAANTLPPSDDEAMLT